MCLAQRVMLAKGIAVGSWFWRTSLHLAFGIWCQEPHELVRRTSAIADREPDALAMIANNMNLSTMEVRELTC